MGLLDDITGATGAGISAARDWLVRSDDDVTPTMMAEVLEKGGIAQPTHEKPRAMFHDPYAIMDWGGWRQRPSALTYDTLRQMAAGCAPITSIIQLRVNQISQFARPQQSPYDKGYRVVLRDRRDSKRSMSKAEQGRAAELERMLETTGWLLPNEKPVDRDSFRTFVKKSVRDVLTYDQWCFEKLRDRQGRPSRFIALPSETIRPAVADIEHMEVEMRRERVSHVQVYENTVIAEFAPDDVAWCIMNPRSDIRANSFGLSPVEQSIRIVTAWLFGFEYNQKFFTQGSAIKGLINIKGAIPDKQMRAFRRMWYSMVGGGITNAWRTPILNSEDIQWVNMHSSNRDVEFSAWSDYLNKLLCSIYGVDPIEINFQYGNTGQSSSLNQGGQEEKVVESKDKGLRPLVDHLTDHLNQHLIWELEEDFEFSFVGMDAKAEEAEREARIKESSAFKTVDEVRAEMDLKPMPDGKGELIRDPSWLQWAMAKDAAEEGMGEEGPMGSDEPTDETGDHPHDWDEDDDLLHADDKESVEDHNPEPDNMLAHDDDEVLAASADAVIEFAQEQLRKAETTRMLKGDMQWLNVQLGEAHGQPDKH